MSFQLVVDLTIGGLTKSELLSELGQRSISLNDYARLLFADPARGTATHTQDIQVAVVTLPEIGLPCGGTFAEILDHASALGLEPCPLDVAPHLRLAYLDQPQGPYLTVASLELRPGPETPNGFYLRHLPDGLWLRGYESGPENVYPPDFTDFAFLWS